METTNEMSSRIDIFLASKTTFQTPFQRKLLNNMLYKIKAVNQERKQKQKNNRFHIEER